MSGFGYGEVRWKKLIEKRTSDQDFEKLYSLESISHLVARRYPGWAMLHVLGDIVEAAGEAPSSKTISHSESGKWRLEDCGRIDPKHGQCLEIVRRTGRTGR